MKRIVDRGTFCATCLLISPYTHKKQQIALKTNLKKRQGGYISFTIEDIILTAENRYEMKLLAGQKLQYFDVDGSFQVLLLTCEGLDSMDTLQSYLKHDGSIQAVAAELYTHRNTVLYRIGNIRKILGNELKTPAGTGGF